MSKTEPKPKALVGVVFTNNITVFGKNTSQISAAMTDLAIRWDADLKRVVVSYVADGADPREEHIHEAAIAKTVWKTQ